MRSRGARTTGEKVSNGSSEPPAMERQLLRASEDANTTGMAVDIPRTSRERIGHRWLVLAAAAAVILLLAGTALVTGTGDDDVRGSATPASSSTPIQTSPTTIPTTVPSNVVTPPITVPGDGSTDDPLLPEGAPSGPHTGELVASAAVFDSGAYYLYADGRLIGWNVTQPGWFEQRLTPEGVERVRSEFLRTGLFDPGQPATEVQSASQVTLCVCVRDGDRLLARSGRRDANVQAAAARLLTYFNLLTSSLPPNEWADQQSKPYVASRNAVCLQMYVHQVEEPPDLAVLLPLFPARAAELLSGRETIDHPEREHARCFEMTLEEARAVADDFFAPSGGGLHEYWGIVIRINRQFDAMQPGANEGNAAYVSFRALLPDGESS
jgi:hypothetical protein